MVTSKEIEYVKLALDRMAGREGDKRAGRFLAQVLDDCACHKIKYLSRRLQAIPGITPEGAINFWVQLGWFLAGGIDKRVPPVL